MTRPPLKAMAAALLLPLIGGCGFTPLYAQPTVGAGLSGVSLETPDTRTGYLLREQLTDALGLKSGAPAQYRLKVQVSERRRPRGLNPDDTATRYELRLDVSYTLTEINGGKVLLKKTRPVFVSDNQTQEPYANIAAQQDSQLRAATEAAQMIKTDVALAVSGQ